MLKHVPLPPTNGQWRIVGFCPWCRGRVVEVRQGTNWGRQEEHNSWCTRLSKQRKERTKDA